jgi:hypothetical protein
VVQRPDLLNFAAEMTTMTKNPILDELHAVREQLLAYAGGSLDALVARLQAKEQKSDRPRYIPQRTVRSAADTSANESATEKHSTSAVER